MFPIAYVMMERKTENLYRAVMQHIMAKLQQIAPGENSVRLMVSDYETAILNTMRESFPNGRERGCWFHFGQASIFLSGVFQIGFCKLFSYF